MQTLHNILHRAKASSNLSPNRRNVDHESSPAPARRFSSSSSSSSRNENSIIKNTVEVICRLRPRLPSEPPSDRSVVEVLNKTEIRITEPIKNLVNRFDFSACYDDQSTQQDIYNGQVHQLVTRMFEGITTTIFAFGCTRSGKTHTLQGTPSDPGITPRAVRTILERVEALNQNPSCESSSFQISLSCFEIWKDKVWDLLVEGGTATTRDCGRGDLPIRETVNGQIIIPNLRHVPISSIPQFDKIYTQIMRTRSVSTTNLNHASSRSHAILTIYLNHQTLQGTTQRGKCVLVDLAGSENNKKTGNEANKERMKESVEINQSLLALRKVVRSLNTGDHRIPYRDSKLTRILSDCLGGTSAALVICNVAPGASQYRDTMNTLTFGSHTRNVENKIAAKCPNSDRTIPQSSSLHYLHHAKSTPNFHSKSFPSSDLNIVPSTPTRTPLDTNWSHRPSTDVQVKSKPSLLPMSPKVVVSRPARYHGRNEPLSPLAISPSTHQPEMNKLIRSRTSYSNLLEESSKQRQNFERHRAVSEQHTIGDLDKRVEEVMRKTLDQLVQTRVDAHLKAKLQGNGLSPSAQNTTPDPEAGSYFLQVAQGADKKVEDEKLSQRIATLEQQFVSISSLLRSVTSSSRPQSTTSRIPGPKLA